MGFFGSLWDGVCSVASRVVDTVKEVAVKAARAAGNVLVKLAEFGEKVVSAVRRVWPKIKPYLEKAAMIIVKVAKGVSLALRAIPHPWAQTLAAFISKGALIVEKGIVALLALENSPILKKIDKALKFILPKMKELGSTLLSWAEIQESRQIQKDLNQLTVVPQSAEEKLLILTKVLNKYQILKSTVVKMLEENSVSNMEHYLQLKATEKIFKKFQERVSSGLKIEELTSEDLFIFDMADVLVSETPMLSEKERERFDKIVEKMFGKSLLAIVFGEMVTFWSTTLEIDNKKRIELKETLAKKEVLKNRLEKDLEFEIALEPDELKTLEQLKSEIPALQEEYNKLLNDIIHQEAYIYAAEGMQRAFEDNILEVVESEETEATIQNQIPELAELLIGCFRNGIQWESLTEAEQGLIRDFANIFQAASKQRAGNLITVQAVA